MGTERLIEAMGIILSPLPVHMTGIYSDRDRSMPERGALQMESSALDVPRMLERMPWVVAVIPSKRLSTVMVLPQVTH